MPIRSEESGELDLSMCYNDNLICAARKIIWDYSVVLLFCVLENLYYTYVLVILYNGLFVGVITFFVIMPKGFNIV